MEAIESLEKFVNISKSDHRNIEDLTRYGANSAVRISDLSVVPYVIEE